ncbi:PilZ domain-containing protein, partial [Spirochaetota bacterium]
LLRKYIMEKRQSARVEFLTETEIIFNNKKIRGSVENLSLKGMFVETGEKDISLNTVIDCNIKLSGSSSKLSIVIKGVISRIEDKGFAVSFKNMELDSFIHLRNIIKYADKELEEFYENE